MQAMDWVAILGALAWTPHVFSAIRKTIARPLIRIVVGKPCEVGFSSFGPIFNIRMAFCVERVDIFVSGLTLKVQHEGGEEKIFEWQSMSQQLLKMTAPDGSIMPYDKEQSALAIKLSQSSVEERFIRCQETVFINKKYEFEEKALRLQSYLKQQGQYETSNFLRSQEMTELYNFIKRWFPWKPGRYTVTLQLESVQPFDLVDNKYEFLLSAMDIENLEKNKDQIELEYAATIGEPVQSNVIKPTWNWCFPNLRKLSGR